MVRSIASTPARRRPPGHVGSRLASPRHARSPFLARRDGRHGADPARSRHPHGRVPQPVLRAHDADRAVQRRRLARLGPAHGGAARHVRLAGGRRSPRRPRRAGRRAGVGGRDRGVPGHRLPDLQQGRRRRPRGQWRTERVRAAPADHRCGLDRPPRRPAGRAASGEEGREKAREPLPDLVVLDIMLPGIDGLEVCRRLRATGDELGILMLTARDEVRDRVEGLETGADDYLVKPFSFEELLARVHALLRRRSTPSGEILRYADLEFDVAARGARRGGRADETTPTHHNLLLLFMRHPKKVLTRDVIMEHVWSYDFEGESNVLEGYVRYLRNKLEAKGEPRLIHTVRGAGYVLKEGWGSHRGSRPR